ncbi:TonB-dependent vitamin B12 receptor [Lysobacter enzymogenes]|uniref:TonB-dependent vitamin B12 receptor n=1 Tax=Lysobacter enzymogenes TaxID=69 RepID=UPI00089739FB|nr:TonB-dependent vitamin B12 receptor [Lysobacter enzymogenes]SDW28750.1 vitamin B12 transporter [Lysobacter enzymogenes]
MPPFASSPLFPRPLSRQPLRALAPALSLALFGVAAGAHAAPAVDLDQVVVTASRTAQTQDATLAAVTVIDRAEIERLQPASLPDLLRGTPGASLANNGGPGKSTSLFLRGTESDHVLVLVDGIKLGSATSGGASLQDIPVEQIERVEIVRGPFSSLYGSEAIGGVIQIFTRRPQGPFAPSFSVGIGSNATHRAAAGVAGKGERGWYSINAAHEDTDGINACRGKPSPGGAGCFTNSPDRDGYRNTSLTMQGGYRFNEQWDAEARVFRAEGYNEYDGSQNNQADIVQQVAGAKLRYRPSDRLALSLNAGRSWDLSEQYKDGKYSSTFDTRRQLGSLQGDLGLGGGLLTLGFDWQRDQVDSNTAYKRDSRVLRGAFGQYQREFGAHALQASVRRDDDSQFGGKTTGSVLWGWNLSDALRLTASYGTAFKAPTFNELYYPGYGNPDLSPETSRSFELGLRGTFGEGGRQVWSLNAYQTRIDDLIAYDASIGLPGNVDRARIRGLEAVLDTRLAGWDLRTSATWLDPRNDSRGSYRDNVLPRRARQSARIDLDRRFEVGAGDALSFGASVYAANDRYDDLANARRLGGYALTDLRVGYALGTDWSVQLAANNLFDRRYETAAFYNQPGRTYLLSLRYRPQR